MESYREKIDLYSSESLSTGSHDDIEEFKIITYLFGKYEIKVKLSYSNEFIGIVEVKVNSDFLSLEQRLASAGYHDVEEFYEDVEK